VTVSARHNTPAYRAAQRPQPAAVFTQDQLRERRRLGLTHTYTGGWSLTAEVQQITAPLAERIAAAPRPSAYRRYVEDITDAVHAAVSAAAALLARADAQRRCQHLGVDERGRSVRALVDLAERPELPAEVTDQQLTDGTWAATLTALARPYSDDLSRLLGAALTSRVSERLDAELRDVDRAALSLARRLDRDERSRSAKTGQTPAPTETDRARAELAALGIET
jgi:hypothetical protein